MASSFILINCHLNCAPVSVFRLLNEKCKRLTMAIQIFQPPVLFRSTGHFSLGNVKVQLSSKCWHLVTKN